MKPTGSHPDISLFTYWHFDDLWIINACGMLPYCFKIVCYSKAVHTVGDVYDR